MKILSPQSTFFQALPSHFKVIYPAVEVVDVLDKTVTHGPKTIIVSEDKVAADLIEMVNANGYKHIVQFNTDYFLQDLEMAALIIDKPEMYFSGHAHTLVKEPKRTMQFEFNSPDQKQEIFTKIEEFVGEIRPQNVRESTLIITEELYMNALMDAPKEATTKWAGEHPYMRGEKAKLTLIESEDRLAISCSDPYGSLSIAKFMNRIGEVYRRGAGEAINMKMGSGAGIGCMIMFENCDNLFLGVIPGKLTVVSCLIPTGLNYRRRAEIKKSLHLITI